MDVSPFLVASVYSKAPVSYKVRREFIEIVRERVAREASASPASGREAALKVEALMGSKRIPA